MDEWKEEENLEEVIYESGSTAINCRLRSKRLLLRLCWVCVSLCGDFCDVRFCLEVFEGVKESEKFAEEVFLE